MSEPADASGRLDVVVPKLGESITEAVVAKWLKEPGAAVATDEPIVELETDKVTVAVPAPQAGVLTERRFEAGATVKVGEVVARITPGAVAAAPASTIAAASAVGGSAVVASAPQSVVVETTRPIPRPHTLPPSVRRAIREGAAPEAPAEAAAESRAAAGSPPPTAAPATAPPGAIAEPATRPTGAAPSEEVVPMSPLRKRIAARLVEAQHSAAILTTFNEVDMSAVLALRARFQEEFTKQHGVKLGFMSFFVRACAESLKRFPGLNAEVRGDAIVYKKHYDFGIAVGSGKGLVVPVVRDVDRRSLAEIERSIAELAARARDNRLTLDDLSGGTFSITNGGIYGSMMSTPLLNLPQTGILGMHNIIKRPVAVGDTIALRPMMYLALSYDHRVADGREAVQFLVGVKERIEAPERMLLAV